jgi:hypothetical protein
MSTLVLPDSVLARGVGIQFGGTWGEGSQFAMGVSDSFVSPNINAFPLITTGSYPFLYMDVGIKNGITMYDSIRLLDKDAPEYIPVCGEVCIKIQFGPKISDFAKFLVIEPGFQKPLLFPIDPSHIVGGIIPVNWMHRYNRAVAMTYMYIINRATNLRYTDLGAWNSKVTVMCRELTPLLPAHVGDEDSKSNPY